MSSVLVLLYSLSLQDSKPPEFVKWEVARERVGHKVVFDSGLKNGASAELANLKVTALYFEGEREIKRSAAVPVAKIAPGATVAVKIETVQVPNFDRAEIYVESPAATFVYAWTETTALPAIRPASGARLTLSSHTLSPLTLVVRNGGGTPADEPTAALTFRDASGGVVHRARVRLERSIGTASEDTFEISVPGVPAHASIEAAFAFQASDELALPDPPAFARELQVRQCKAVRLTDGSARVSGILANATPGSVQRINVRFQLGRHEAAFEPSGVLKAGESRPFVFYAPSCPPFDSLGFTLGCDTGGAAGGELAMPSARRTATKRVEADRVSLPPPPKVVQEAAGVSGPRPPSVGTRGLLVVEGVFGKNNKYTGDHYLVRMLFLDEKGKPYQPEATVTFSLYDGDKHLKKATRTVTRASWGADSTRVNGQTIDLETMAFDRKTGELWITLHWTDVPWKKPRADFQVEIKDAGTFTLKGVEKDWHFAPQWPDAK